MSLTFICIYFIIKLFLRIEVELKCLIHEKILILEFDLFVIHYIDSNNMRDSSRDKEKYFNKLPE